MIQQALARLLDGHDLSRSRPGRRAAAWPPGPPGPPGPPSGDWLRSRSARVAAVADCPNAGVAFGTAWAAPSLPAAWPAAMAPRSAAACCATSAAVAGRAAGSLAVSLPTSAATPSGTGGSGGSGLCRLAVVTSSGVPRNGGVPARHSNATTPSEYRSLAGVAAAPAARSGAR